MIAALGALVPADVVVGARAVRADDVDHLPAAEAALIATAAPVRRREFASGRVLLHHLLPGVGPIGCLANGAPDVGGTAAVSLAHDREYAVAVVGSARSSLGVDLEPLGALTAEIADLVVRPDDEVLGDPLLGFVAKEAVYKAWSRAGRPILEFTDVRVTVDADGTFEAQVLVDGTRLIGATTTAAGRRLATAHAPSP